MAASANLLVLNFKMMDGVTYNEKDNLCCKNIKAVSSHLILDRVDNFPKLGEMVDKLLLLL